MRRPRAVLLDFGGTLDSAGVHWSTLLARAFVAAGVTLERRLLDQAFLAADQELARASDVAGLGLGAHVERQARLMLDRLGLEAARAPEIAGPVVAEARAYLARSRALLESHRVEFTFALVSNFTANLERIVAEVGIAPLLGAVLCSAVEGVSKPDPALFRRALERLSAAPAEAAMVGDSLPSDIMPAKALGLTTVWIRGDQVFGRGDESAADHVVPDLAGALDWLRAGSGDR